MMLTEQTIAPVRQPSVVRVDSGMPIDASFFGPAVGHSNGELRSSRPREERGEGADHSGYLNPAAPSRTCLRP